MSPHRSLKLRNTSVLCYLLHTVEEHTNPCLDAQPPYAQNNFAIIRDNTVISIPLSAKKTIVSPRRSLPWENATLLVCYLLEEQPRSLCKHGEPTEPNVRYSVSCCAFCTYKKFAPKSNPENWDICYDGADTI